MEYIPDKKLYSAVMFALKMSPCLQGSRDRDVETAANYYHVKYKDVLTIVRKELWERAINEAKKESDRWYNVYNPDAPELLGTDNYVFICPRCGRHFACDIHDDSKLNMLYISQCVCGFADDNQRKFTRRWLFEQVSEKEKKWELLTCQTDL